MKEKFVEVPANSLSKAKRGLILGVGVNDAPYMAEIRVNGKRIVCPAYRAWKHILRRCYCDKFLSENKTYSEVKVSEEWHLFSNFKKWFEENHVEGWQIDKDILTDSKMYSKETCIYVPRWLNNLTEDHRSARGEFKIGVCRARGGVGFLAQCSDPRRSSSYIGVYPTEDEAHKAWLKKKKEIAFMFKKQMDDIDNRIYERVITIIKRLK